MVDTEKGYNLKAEGDREMRKGLFFLAITLYDQALDILKNDVAIKCNKALAYIRVEWFDKAI